MTRIPHDEATAILDHYFAQLARACGLHWSEQNAADIVRAVDLMAQADAPPSDAIPPYRPVVTDRVTQVLARDELPSGGCGDPEFERWRKMRRAEEHDTRRMLRREGGAR